MSVGSIWKINKCVCFHIAEILTLFCSYWNMSASSEPNENSTHQNQIMFIMSRNGWKFWILSAWLKYVGYLVFEKGKNRFQCKYCQRLFSVSIFCVINKILVGIIQFLNKEVFTKPVVHPKIWFIHL